MTDLQWYDARVQRVLYGATGAVWYNMVQCDTTGCYKVQRGTPGCNGML